MFQPARSAASGGLAKAAGPRHLTAPLPPETRYAIFLFGWGAGDEPVTGRRVCHEGIRWQRRPHSQLRHIFETSWRDWSSS